MTADAQFARALSRLDLAAKNLSRVEEVMRRAESLPRNVVMGIIDYAARTLRPTIIAYIQRNFARSGIKSRTGKLARALKRVMVVGSITRSGQPVIRVQMPPGISPYRDGGKQSDFYRVAAALNYGAVRAGMQECAAVDLPTGRVGASRRVAAVGSRAKRTIKAHALGRNVSSRAIEAVESGRKTRLGQQLVAGRHIGSRESETAGAVKLTSGIVVIKPREFFHLTPSQRRRVAREFERIVITGLENWILRGKA